MKRRIIIVAALLLTGCAAGTFTTRASVTLSGDKVILNSQYGALPSIGTELDERDAATILQALRAKAAMEFLMGIRTAPAKPAAADKAI